MTPAVREKLYRTLGILEKEAILQLLADRMIRAAECVRLNSEALAGAIPETLEERRDMLAEALEWQAETQAVFQAALVTPEPGDALLSLLPASLITKLTSAPKSV